MCLCIVYYLHFSLFQLEQHAENFTFMHYRVLIRNFENERND